MNTTDYFTYVNAMFLFCIFTCGLLLAVGWRLTRKSDKLKEEQESHLKATKINSLLSKENKEIDDKLAQAEHKLREAEKEIRELQGQLDHAELQANGYKTEFIATFNELEATKAKVRKRDKDGKFLPSGNGRVRTPKKLKLIADLGENEVIHCKTAKERLAIRKLMHEAGLKWSDGREYIGGSVVADYKNICHYPKNGTHCPLTYSEKSGHTIHPASDFIARPKRVKKVKEAFDELSDHAKEASAALDNFSELFSTTTLPKLVHGLTVKNPTEAEAKMIFDEAKRLGLSTYAEHRIDLPFIWWSVTDTVSRCADSDWPVEQIFVTAKEFVQRMQNGRG